MSDDLRTQLPGRTALADVLHDLAGLVGPSQRADVEELVHRLELGRLRLLVVGEAKRGKSSLINALLGSDVLPTGVVPVTSIATTIVHRQPAALHLTFTDGHQETRPVSDLARYVTEQANPSNALGVESVTVSVDAPWLAQGIELVDTPGTGSIHEQNTDEALRSLGTMDVAVFVLTADSPLSAADRALLAQVSAQSVQVFCVLNKVDLLQPDELVAATEYVAAGVQVATGSAVTVIPCSVRLPPESGLDPLRNALLAYLSTHRSAALELSIRRRAEQLTAHAQDEVAVRLRVLELRDHDAESLVTRFDERLAQVVADQRPTEMVDAMHRGVLTDLNARAGQASQQIRRRVDDLLDKLFASPAGQGSPRQIEEQIRAHAVSELQPWLESWHAEARDTVAHGLDGVVRRLAELSQATVLDVRQSARDLLGLELIVDLTPIELPTDHEFYYVFDPTPSQSELLAGAVRRRLPGELGRKRARAHTRRLVQSIRETQVGRVRADLQRRLTEATRGLQRAATTHHRDLVGGLQAAVAAAGEARRGSAEELASASAQLQDEQRHLSLIRSVLAQPLDAEVAC